VWERVPTRKKGVGTPFLHVPTPLHPWLEDFKTARTGHYVGRHISGHNSPAARAKELFKPSEDPVSLLESIFLKMENFGVRFFVDDVIIG